MSTENIDTTGNAVETQIESIYLTPSSLKPIWLAISLMVALYGVFSFWPLLVGGGVVALLITASWISESRSEVNELPRS